MSGIKAPTFANDFDNVRHYQKAIKARIQDVHKIRSAITLLSDLGEHINPDGQAQKVVNTADSANIRDARMMLTSVGQLLLNSANPPMFPTADEKQNSNDAIILANSAVRQAVKMLGLSRKHRSK